MDAKQFAQGLREIADWYEAHPDAVVPFPSIQVSHLGGPDREREVLVWLSRNLASCHKEILPGDSLYSIWREFSGVKLEFIAWKRNVCERVQIGTQKVKKQVPIESVAMREEEVEEPVYEWRCGSLLDSGQEDIP